MYVVYKTVSNVKVVVNLKMIYAINKILNYIQLLTRRSVLVYFQTGREIQLVP